MSPRRGAGPSGNPRRPAPGPAEVPALALRDSQGRSSGPRAALASRGLRRRRGRRCSNANIPRQRPRDAERPGTRRCHAIFALRYAESAPSPGRRFRQHVVRRNRGDSPDCRGVLSCQSTTARREHGAAGTGRGGQRIATRSAHRPSSAHHSRLVLLPRSPQSPCSSHPEVVGVRRHARPDRDRRELPRVDPGRRHIRVFRRVKRHVPAGRPHLHGRDPFARVRACVRRSIDFPFGCARARVPTTPRHPRAGSVTKSRAVRKSNSSRPPKWRHRDTHLDSYEASRYEFGEPAGFATRIWGAGRLRDTNGSPRSVGYSSSAASTASAPPAA
jgi:hypothetical protein